MFFPYGLVYYFHQIAPKPVVRVRYFILTKANCQHIIHCFHPQKPKKTPEIFDKNYFYLKT